MLLGEETAWYQEVMRQACQTVSKNIADSRIRSLTSSLKDVAQDLKNRVSPAVSPETSDCGTSPRDIDLDEARSQTPSYLRAFEFGDLLEEGAGPGFSVTHTLPPKLDTEVRIRVRRAADRRSFTLVDPAGSSLMIARHPSKGSTDFDIFVARDGDPPRALGPAFQLKPKDVACKEWRLTSVRCEECELRGKRKCGVRELARMSHYNETVGSGTAFCMDVDIPEYNEDGRCDIWCTRCSENGMQDRCAELTSRRPKWNPRRKDLQLDFKGRVSCASAKNFQLEARNAPGKATLLFGKVAADEFVLDFTAPLSAVQAFAAALTTSHWA